MRLLLDTHALIWWNSDYRQLQTKTFEAILDGQNQVFVSIVAPWEIAIKQKTGKLNTPDINQRELEDSGFTLLPISLDHVDIIRSLPLHHRDPFDRIMIAQAMVEGLTFVTRDRHFDAYDVDILPA